VHPSSARSEVLKAQRLVLGRANEEMSVAIGQARAIVVAVGHWIAGQVVCTMALHGMLQALREWSIQPCHERMAAPKAAAAQALFARPRRCFNNRRHEVSPSSNNPGAAERSAPSHRRVDVPHDAHRGTGE